jgi:hypothetical protein
MNPEDLDAALTKPDYAPAPAKLSPTTPVGALLIPTVEQARAMAARHGLIRPNGTVRCSTPHCGGDAALPFLDCPRCRERRVGR